MEEKDIIQKPVGIRILRGMIIGLGLLLLNLIFVLGPFIAIWSVVFAMVVSGFAVAVSGIALIITYLFTLPISLSIPLIMAENPILLALSGGIFIGIGGILTFLFIWFGKYLGIGTGKYVMWQVDLIRGDEHE